MRTAGIATAFIYIYLAASFQVLAQVTGSIEFGSGYDDNVFSNANFSPSSYGSAALTMGYYPEESNFGISYSGLFASYGAFPDRQYSLHNLIASYSIPLGEQEETSVSVAGLYNLRADAEAYNYYDYNQGMAYAAVRHYLSQVLSGNAGYALKFRKYPNFSDLSYLEHIAWLGGNTSLESRTSITVRAELGVKNYSPVNIDAADPGTSATSGVTSNGLTVEDGGPGSGGNGGNNGGGNGNGNMGNGNGNKGSGNKNMSNGGMMSQIGQNYSNLGETAQIVTYDDATTSQLRASVTVGQGIADGTGLSATYLKRFNLNDRSRAVVGGTVDFIGEEDLFDDPYSYESDEASLKLTQILPSSMKLQVGGFTLWKQYSYPSDLADMESPIRNDTRYGGYLSLSKSIAGNWLMFDGLELSLGYTYTRNQSNTAWYDYSSNGISFGIGTDF